MDTDGKSNKHLVHEAGIELKAAAEIDVAKCCHLAMLSSYQDQELNTWKQPQIGISNGILYVSH